MKIGEIHTKEDNTGVVFLFIVGLALILAFAFLISIFVVLPVGIAYAVGWWWFKNKRRGTPTDQMYAQTEQRVLSANFPSNEEFMDAFVSRTIEAAYDDNPPAYPIVLALIQATGALYKAERLGSPVPPMPTAGTIEDGRYRDELLASQRKSMDPAATLAAFSGAIAEVQGKFFDQLPPMARVKPEVFALANQKQPFSFPLIDLLDNPAKIVTDLITPFYGEQAREIGLFSLLRRQIDANVEEQGCLPEEYKGKPKEMVRAYLKNTPLEALFEADVPFEVPVRSRLEHTLLVAGSGHGKTQLLQSIIAQDLAKEDPPGLIIIDSTGSMINKIQQLDIFDPDNGRLKDRLLIIDPEDEQSPALNMFDSSNARMKGYTRTQQEQLEAEVIELFNYVFASIASELTAQQSTAFAFVVRLLLSIPGSTIKTLTELLEEDVINIEKSRFRGDIAKLDSTAQGFFQNQFYSKRFDTTRKGIAARLYNVMRVPAFDRMFSGVNKLDMFEAMQDGKIVLVNTSINLLKGEASSLFGRYLIAKAMTAAFERVNIPENQRRPCFLIVDEANPYTDSNIETLLTKVRQFRLGVLLAYQNLDHEQIKDHVKSALISSTTVKYVAALNPGNARYIAPVMRTTQEFIDNQRKDGAEVPKWTQFACYVRNYTEHALSLTIPTGVMEKLPKMSAASLSKLRAKNSALIGGTMAETIDDDTAAQNEPTVVEPAPPKPTETPDEKLWG